jgi:glutathione S-transferase
MIKLYHAPRTRSIRVLWLLEELDLPRELMTIEYQPPATPFAQRTPSGKFPTLEDGETVMFESGAIVEYLLERYGQGRLGPRAGEPGRGVFLQWLHFAEATLLPPLIEILRHTLLKPEAERIPAVVADAKVRAAVTLGVLERALQDREYLLGADFSAADVMMGYGVQWAAVLGLLGDSPNLRAYHERLSSRPALQKALAVT